MIFRKILIIALLYPQKQQEGKTQSNNFGGFKKGFLLSNPKVTKSQTGGGQATSSTNSSSEKIEEITRRDPSQAKDPLVFSEVQAALEAQMPLLKSKGVYVIQK